MFENSSEIVCCLPRAEYNMSKIKKFVRKYHTPVVTNLFRPTMNNLMEHELSRLVGSDIYNPKEIALRLSDWNPDVNCLILEQAASFFKVWDAIATEYTSDSKKAEEMNKKLLSSMFCYSYLLGYNDALHGEKDEDNEEDEAKEIEGIEGKEEKEETEGIEEMEKNEKT